MRLEGVDRLGINGHRTRKGKFEGVFKCLREFVGNYSRSRLTPITLPKRVLRSRHHSHAFLRQLRECLLCRIGCDSGGEVTDQSHVVLQRMCVRDGLAYAVVGRQPAHENVGDAVAQEEVFESDTLDRLPLKGGICRYPATLHHLDMNVSRV